MLIALPVASRLTENDFSIGLLLQSVEYFALGLTVVSSVLFFFLVFFGDVPKTIKLRAFSAVILPYLVLATLLLISNAKHAGR